MISKKPLQKLRKYGKINYVNDKRYLQKKGSNIYVY